MNKFKVVGISGTARSGKDTFARILRDELQKDGYKVKIFAFAHALKEQCKDYVFDTWGLDVFSQKTEEKNVFRQYLVDYAKQKRAETNGSYFVDILHNELNSFNGDVAIVSDVRFHTSERDEVRFVKQRGGVLVHVSRTDVNGVLIGPANSEEAEHDPRVFAEANYYVNWPTKNEKSVISVEEWCLPYVSNFILHQRNNGFFI